jgi:hypothetical protein
MTFLTNNLLSRCNHFYKIAANLPEITRTSQLNINHSGMRNESMKIVRKQRQNGEKMRPIVVTVFPDGLIALNDGRHRLAVARERGDKSITAHIIYYDDELNVIHEETRDLLID